MTDTQTCSQRGCGKLGVSQFTWPGEEQKVICDKHVGWLMKVADAMGLEVNLIPLSPVGVGKPEQP